MSAAIGVASVRSSVMRTLTSSGAIIRKQACVAVFPGSGVMPAASHLARDSARFFTLNPMYSMVDPSVPPFGSPLRIRKRTPGNFVIFSCCPSCAGSPPSVFQNLLAASMSWKLKMSWPAEAPAAVGRGKLAERGDGR